LADVWIGII